VLATAHLKPAHSAATRGRTSGTSRAAPTTSCLFKVMLTTQYLLRLGRWAKTDGVWDCIGILCCYCCEEEKLSESYSPQTFVFVPMAPGEKRGRISLIR
jgi:hypothetical protein